MINPADIQRIWSLPDGSIPAVHAERWDDVVPNNFRALALDPPSPVPVTERRPVPEWLASRKPLTQLILAGVALLEAVKPPALHLSLAGGRLVRATGTTILLIEGRKDGEIVACPWSEGESRATALKRLIALRKAPPPGLTAREAYIARRLLPRCQAAISVVSGFDIENPGTNILASGGDCPISVTIGTKSIHFALDHRIYDPADAGLLYKGFFSTIVGLGRGMINSVSECPLSSD